MKHNLQSLTLSLNVRVIPAHLMPCTEVDDILFTHIVREIPQEECVWRGGWEFTQIYIDTT